MEIGIIGLPQSGKTTIFNALTKGVAETVNYSGKPNVGVAKVPDRRLAVLMDMYNPRRVVPANMIYTDLPPSSDSYGESVGLQGKHLNDLQSTDALLVVVRSFDLSSVPHVEETIDPIRDAGNMLLEIIFSDLGIVDRRLIKIEQSFKGAKTEEREVLTREKNLLLRIKQQLDAGVSVNDQDLSDNEIKLVSGFGLLSGKPLIVVMNIGENQLVEQEFLEEKLALAVAGESVRTAVICAQLEMELAQIESSEEYELRRELGTGESSLSRMVRLSYEVVGQISFFTVGEDEVRAWEIRIGTAAQQAAGKIHSDLERGFIRAEVIPFDDLVECGGLVEARKKGLLRQEGKNYILKDGEIMHVLFNV